MTTLTARKFHGADYAFNRSCTMVTSVKNRKTQVKWKWILRCLGCGHESEYTNKQFNDPYDAAVTALEYHRCVEPNDTPVDNNG